MSNTRCFRVNHTTVYNYRNPVAFGQHSLLAPAGGTPTLRVDPASKVSWSFEHSARVASISFGPRSRAKKLEFELQFDARTASTQDLFRASASNLFSVDSDVESKYSELAHPEGVACIEAWINSLRMKNADLYSACCAMNKDIYAYFEYERRDVPGTRTPCQTLRYRSGACRDFASLMAEALRYMGFPARLAMGYLAASNSGTSTHAWVQVYVPKQGWFDVDPTNNLVGDDCLIFVAESHSPNDLAPITGTYIGLMNDSKSMDVSVQIEEIPT